MDWHGRKDYFIDAPFANGSSKQFGCRLALASIRRQLWTEFAAVFIGSYTQMRPKDGGHVLGMLEAGFLRDRSHAQVGFAKEILGFVELHAQDFAVDISTEHVAEAALENAA